MAKRKDHQSQRAAPHVVAAGAPLWDTASRRPALVLVLVCVACLTPFLHKAYHIDDPLFLWAAQQIQTHPLNPYGFTVRWSYVAKPMSEETKNPPLACYYLALAGWITRGWREVPLHLAFLVWPLGVAWGTYRLAQRFCSRPLLAALTAILTPVTLVSATSIMSDMMMLCLWVWAIAWWDRGQREGSWAALVLAAVLVGACALTKYFGANLLPLLLVYTLMLRAGQGSGIKVALADAGGFWARLLPLLIPVAILAAYQYATWRLYGRGLLSDAASYATDLRARFTGRFPLSIKLLMGLVFTGGCIATTLFYLPFLLKWQCLPRTLVAGCLLVVASIATGALLTPTPVLNAGFGTRFTWQATLFCAAGLTLAALTVDDLWTRRDASAWLLFLWVAGTMAFAAFVNWAVNGRSILPLAPAAGILLMRRLDRVCGPAHGRPQWSLLLPLAPAAALALAVAYADCSQAGTARAAARMIGKEFAGPPGTLLFEGHWGFQYYLEREGGQVVVFPAYVRATQSRQDWVELMSGSSSIVDWMEPGLKPGDRLVEPSNNSDVFTVAYRMTSHRLTGSRVRPLKLVPFMPCGWLSTTQPSLSLRAGFYSHTYGGELPYSFGPVPREEYRVFESR